MNNVIELIKENERLFFDNAEGLTDGEDIQEDIEGYLAIQGATEEELNTFESQFQIKLPEDFKDVYRYKNGSGYIRLLWPQEGFYRGYQLMTLHEMSKIKSYFQNENHEIACFTGVTGQNKTQQPDSRIKPYLSCERWFPFARYEGSFYLMLDYNPRIEGKNGQIICYAHDPDFVYYIAPDITVALEMTKTVIDGLV